MDARKLSAIVLALTLSLTMFGGCLDDDGPRIPTNEAPVADVQGPATGYVGEELTFNASGSADDEDAESLSYVWEFEEGVLLIQMGPFV